MSFHLSQFAASSRPGDTEEILGRWFAQGGGRRDAVILATKVFGAVKGRPTCQNRIRTHVLCTVKSGLPNVEEHRFIDDRFIAVKSRGNHGPALVELFEVQTGILRDKVMAFAVQKDQDGTTWAKE